MTGPSPTRAPTLATALPTAVTTVRPTVWPTAVTTVLPTVVTALALALAAVARQQAMAALSPVDLAFYTQSAWSASHGQGFRQTVLSFEGGGLWDSVHLSPARLLYVPMAWALGATGLVALQGAAVGLGLGAVGALARRAGASPAVAAVLVLTAALHPLSLALATADARPIVLLVPALLWAAWALWDGRLAVLLPCGLLAIAAREEAAWVLAALLPWAWGRPRTLQLGLATLILLALALPLATWGHLGATSLHEDPAGALADLIAGRRPVLRDAHEGRFLLLCLLAAPSALLAPRLLLPGLLGWLALITLSEREPAHASGAGVHYLAVAHPFLLAAAAVGAGRLSARGRPWAVATCCALLGLGVGASAAGWSEVAGWAQARLSGEHRLAARLDLLQAPADDAGAVLTVPAAAPLLADREGLWVPGHVDADPAVRLAVARTVAWAILPDRLGGAEDAEGIRPEEVEAWRAALAGAGLEVDRRGGGLERWWRGLSPPAP